VRLLEMLTAQELFSCFASFYDAVNTKREKDRTLVRVSGSAENSTGFAKFSN